MKPNHIGYALCASYCTFDSAIEALGEVCGRYAEVTPVMSENAYDTDTRFGEAAGFRARLEALCGKPVLHTMAEVEPFGPGALLDLLVVAPCTGNTLAKLAAGVTDTAVTMACKAQLRNGRPVLLAISTNDALSGNAKNLGALMDRKNIFFVPFYQDDPAGKPASACADFTLLPDAIDAALGRRQLQPVLRGK